MPHILNDQDLSRILQEIIEDLNAKTEMDIQVNIKREKCLGINYNKNLLIIHN